MSVPAARPAARPPGQLFYLCSRCEEAGCFEDYFQWRINIWSNYEQGWCFDTQTDSHIHPSVSVTELCGFISTGRIKPNIYPERVRRAEVELLPDVFRRSGAQPVEDVVVPLLGALPADPRLLQQVVRHEAADHGVLGRKRQFWIYCVSSCYYNKGLNSMEVKH